MALKRNLCGQKFNNWLVIEDKGGPKVTCKCLCENGTTREVYVQALKNNRSKSCGCLGKTKYKGEEITNYNPGDKVYEWTIIKSFVDKANASKYLATCSCNKDIVHEIYRSNLIRGTHKSCGHEKRASKNSMLGQRYGEWTVLKILPNDKALCQCSCENKTEKILYRKTLKEGRSKSCGCKSIEHCKQTTQNKYKQYIGKQFGEWTVIDTSRIQEFLCQCSCKGENSLRYVSKKTLLEGKSKSCGCAAFEYSKQTSLDRYGDAINSRANNPREQWQVDILHDKDGLINLIESLTSKNDSKPYISELSNILNISDYHTIRVIKQMGLTSMINKHTVRSQFEIEVESFIRSNCKYAVETSVKGILSNNKELDIYIPSLKLAVECNGNYWHSELFKSNNYHLEKTLECSSLGIHLIHIFEYEWENSKDIIKSILNNSLHNSNMIYARNTDVITIDNKTAKDFLNKYHLQGGIDASINIALTYQNKIVSLMTFGKPRFDSNEEYELYRACNISDVAVIGGFSKMLTYFIDKINPESIVTYSDLSKFKTTVYEKLNFKFDKITPPSYVWSNGNNFFTRYQTQKHKLLEKGLGTDDMSESEIMHEHRYYKIYNSGNAKYIWRKTT